MPHDILIVDDSATIRHMIRRTLGLIGLDIGTIWEASNGIEALAVLGDHPVAAMILDINMPRMNGLQLIERMKNHDTLRHVPIIIVSTEGSRQRIEQLRASGVVGFVRKPFAPEQLRDVLAPILGEQHDHTPADNATGRNVFQSP